MKKLFLLIVSALMLFPSLAKAQDFPNSYQVTYDGGDQIIIAWPGSGYVDYMMGYGGVYLQAADGTKIDVPYGGAQDPGFTLYWGNDESGLEVRLNGLGLVDGTSYTLHFPQGFIEVDDADWDEYVSPEINFTFTYGQPGGGDTPVDFPNSYTTTYSDGVIIIAWPGSGYVDYKMGYEGVYLQAADGSKIDVPFGGAQDPGFALYWGNDESGLEVRLNGLGLVDGTSYTLHFPQGFIEVDDADWDEYESPEINYTFTYIEIGGGGDTPVDFPNSYTTTYSDDVIIIAWPGSGYVDYKMGYEGVYLQAADGTKIDVPYGGAADPGFTLYWGNDESGLEVRLNGLGLVDGTTYTLHFPQGFIEVDDADWDEYVSPEINYTFVYGAAPLEYMQNGVMTNPDSYVTFASASYKAPKLVDIKYAETVSVAENAPGVILTVGNNDPITLSSRNYEVFSSYLEIDFMNYDFDEFTGKYVIEVPAGVVKNAAGAINPAQTFEFFVASGTTSIVPVLTPAEDSDVPQFSKITVSWDNENITYLGGEAYFDNDDDEVFPLTFGDNINIVDGNQLQINVGALAVGTYYLNIPQNYIAFADGTVSNGLALVKFNVVKGEPAYMAEGRVVVPSENVLIADAPYKAQKTVDIDYGKPVTLVEGAPDVVVTIADNDPVTLRARNYFLYGTYLEIDFMNLDFDNYVGKYVVEIPAGLVQNADGEVNPAQTIEYYVVSGVSKIEPTITPADGKVKQNEVITISWDDLDLEFLGGAMYFDNDDDDVINLVYGEDYTIENNNTLTIKVTDIPAGTYYLNYPQGLVLLSDGNVNATSGILEFIIEAATSGVCSIDADAEGLWVVYDLNGVNVMTTNNYDNVRNLAKGLYIVNGKKVFIVK